MLPDNMSESKAGVGSPEGVMPGISPRRLIEIVRAGRLMIEGITVSGRADCDIFVLCHKPSSIDPMISGESCGPPSQTSIASRW